MRPTVLALVLPLLAALPADAHGPGEMVVTLRGGQQQVFRLADVERIEFRGTAGGQVAAPATPILVTPPPVAYPQTLIYLGCFRDQGARDIGAYTFENAGMTTEMCVQECARRGFPYAATQYARHCFCGNTYGQYGQAGNCDMKCSGNSKQVCGGSWANSVFQLRR